MTCFGRGSVPLVLQSPFPESQSSSPRSTTRSTVPLVGASPRNRPSPPEILLGPGPPSSSYYGDGGGSLGLSFSHTRCTRFSNYIYFSILLCWSVYTLFCNMAILSYISEWLSPRKQTELFLLYLYPILANFSKLATATEGLICSLALLWQRTNVRHLHWVRARKWKWKCEAIGGRFFLFFKYLFH